MTEARALPPRRADIPLVRPLAAPALLPSLTLGWNLIESLVIFAAGFCLMMFFYSATGGINGEQRYVPEHDSWYHIKMAVLMPHVGILRELPWLQYGYLDPGDPLGKGFVSHHFGFQVLLIPFVYLSKWTTGDYLPGARWAISAFFGGIVMLINMLLITAGVRLRWIWLTVFLLMPFQFFSRHAFIRSIAPSLLLMLIVLLFMFRNRPVRAGIATACYILLYLGGVTFAPVLIGAYALGMWFGPAGERRFPWKMVLWCAGGALVGLLLYPYPKRALFNFLRLQVFETGLGADIEVGQEWLPYNNTWWFMQMCGALLAVWTIALLVRLRMGPHLNATETTLMILNFGFLLLTLKCRRFIEYWPVFALLSAACLLAPVSQRIAAWWEREVTASAPEARLFRIGSIIIALSVYLGAATLYVFRAPNFREAWKDGRFDWLKELAGNGWLLTAVGLVIMWGFIRSIDLRETSLLKNLDRLGPVLVAVVACLGLVTNVNARNLHGVHRDLICTYDIKGLRAALDFLQRRSQPGDIVFTDDWDDFGLYMYHNSHNYYIVGLDPKFTHGRRPDLWERFVKITRAQTPTDETVKMPLPGGKTEDRRIHIDVADIRDEFKARYVICDSVHRNFAEHLSKSPELFRLIYPCEKYEECRDAAYILFQVLPPS